MSADDKRLNYVTFLPDGANVARMTSRVYLKLEGEFVLTAGVRPSGPNRAILPYTEFAKLFDKDGIFRPRGAIEFWESLPDGDGPPTPKHWIGSINIVFCEPMSYGTPVGEAQPIITEYRLFLSDRRCLYSAPYCSYLSLGRINVTKGKLGSLYTNSQLIQLCLDAMGVVLAAALSKEVEELPAIEDLDWNGADPADELVKILDKLGAAMCVRSDGSVTIEMKGTGDCPDQTGGDAMPEFRLPQLRKGGQSVVVASLPVPVIDTYTQGTIGPNEWEFVISTLYFATNAYPGRDWVTVDEVERDHPTWAREGITWAHDYYQWKEQFCEHAFDHLRLSKRFADPGISPVLNLVINADGTASPPTVRAKIATAHADGWWHPATGFTDVPILLRLRDAKTEEFIFEVAYRLLNVAYDCDNMALTYVRLQAADLQISFSMEGSKGGTKTYFIGGYQRELDRLEPLSESECLTILNGTTHGDEKKDKPKIAVLLRPDLAPRRVDGVWINANAMKAQALAIATKYLMVDCETPRILCFAGLKAVELSGAVNEVRWSQDAFTTMVEVNTWHCPGAMARDRESLRKATQGAFAGESTSVQRRLELGGAGAVTPTVVIGPGQSVAPGGAAVLWATAKTTWTGGNTMWCTRRTSLLDATVPPGSQDVMLDLTMPFWVSPVEVQIGAGDPLPYILIGANEGLCLAIKQGGTGSESIGMGTTAGQVPIMINNADWAWELPFGVNIPVE